MVRVDDHLLNAELNPNCHLLALLETHHILHVSRIRVNPLNAQLNPNCHLLALLETHHILHVSRIRVNPLNAQLNPICHLLALLEAHHILHVSRMRVKVHQEHCANHKSCKKFAFFLQTLVSKCRNPKSYLKPCIIRNSRRSNGCQMAFLTFRKGHKLRVFKKKGENE